MKRYRIYIECARKAYFDADGDNELLAECNALEIMDRDGFEETIVFLDKFGEWKINQIEEMRFK